MALPYWGGKSRIAKAIAQTITDDSDPQRTAYVEPFAGMASVACSTMAIRRFESVVLNDSDERVCAYLDALCNTEWMPKEIPFPSESEWMRMRKAPPDPTLTFYGILLGYAGHMFSGTKPKRPYVKFTEDDFPRVLRRKMVALREFRAAFANTHVECSCVSFCDLPVPSNAVVYCDPPYVASQPGRRMSKSDVKKLETFCARCFSNGCDVYLSNNAVPDFEDVACKVLREWNEFRNNTNSVHKRATERKELLMKIERRESSPTRTTQHFTQTEPSQ